MHFHLQQYTKGSKDAGTAFTLKTSVLVLQVLLT